MSKYKDIQLLLDLSGESFHDESGYWWKISARRVKSTVHIPHGIRYELTLHNRSNQRVMGFDNAHSPKLNKEGKTVGRFSGRIIEWDHFHRYADDKGTAYEFDSAGQLLSDFFDRVNRIIADDAKNR